MHAGILGLFLCLCLMVEAQASTLHSFQIENRLVPLSDGTQISLTIYRPDAKKPGETFPVLFEMLPYRKDDLFFLRNYSLYKYFVERGYILVQADVRGTGSSFGKVPLREYSDEELRDGEELIGYLAGLPESTGQVTMMGISWGGINALQMAMRQPPGLVAVISAAATDDLYRDDVHFIDGILHLDEYHLDMNHETGLPRSPDYPIDQVYIQDRFERTPWILTVLKHQRDSKFWRKKSLREQYDRIRIPVYTIAGQLDSYRDFVPHLLSELSAPVRAILGPWNHSWPDNGDPNPNFEWRSEVLAWLDQKLKPGPQVQDKKLRLFVRDSYLPRLDLPTLPGTWCETSWPLPTSNHELYPTRTGGLSSARPTSGTVDLRAEPGQGESLGFYWGELTGDVRSAGGISFESDILQNDIILTGFPKLEIELQTNQDLIHLVARLEDVHPNQEVSLVTAAALNSSQRENSLDPKPMTRFKENLKLDLHYTTWTFRKGHRIRLSLAHNAFPMLWPAPNLATTQISVGSTRLSLPELSPQTLAGCAVANQQTIEPREDYPDPRYRDLSDESWPANFKTRQVGDWKELTAQGSSAVQNGDWKIEMQENAKHRVHTRKPWLASYLGVISHTYSSATRNFRLRTRLQVRSDKKYFYVYINRELSRSDGPTLERRWNRKVRRDFQ